MENKQISPTMSYSFDAAKFRLGSLCRHGHEYENTGMSLRYTNKQGQCVECKRIVSKKEKAKRKNKKTNLTEAQRLIVQGQGRNPDLYRLGTLCKHRHDWHGTGQSLRMISNGTCDGCYAITNAKSYDKNRESINARAREKTTNDPAYRAEKSRRARQWWYANHEYALEQNRLRKARRSPEQIQRDNEAKERYYRANWEACQWVPRQRSLEEHFENRRIPYSEQDLLERLTDFNGKCAYCSGSFDTENFHTTRTLTWDHVTPCNKGGWDTLLNLVPACKGCNSSKSDKGLEEWYVQQEYFSYSALEYIKSMTLQEAN